MKKPIVIWIILGVIVFAAITAALFIVGPEENQANQNTETSYNSIQIIPDLRKDSIPALTNPGFESGSGDITWLAGSDLVVGININGEARAYPVKILEWHEVVNDVVGGQNIMIAHSPICGLSSVYSRELDGQTLNFGNTGAVYEGCSVIYDEQSNSFWAPLPGQSIKGEHIDQKLSKLPLVVAPWQEWLGNNPETQVLSINTGFSRDYLSEPYADFKDPESTDTYPVANEGDRLRPKTSVVAVEINGQRKAYQISALKDKTIEDAVGDQEVKVYGNATGSAAQINLVSNNQEVLAPVTYSFWFAWYTAFPDTEVLTN